MGSVVDSRRLLLLSFQIVPSVFFVPLQYHLVFLNLEVLEVLLPIFHELLVVVLGVHRVLEVLTQFSLLPLHLVHFLPVLHLRLLVDFDLNLASVGLDILLSLRPGCFVRLVLHVESALPLIRGHRLHFLYFKYPLLVFYALIHKLLLPLLLVFLLSELGLPLLFHLMG